MGRWILFLLTLPMAIFGWAVILALRLFGLTRDLRWEPFLVLTAVRRNPRYLKEFSFTFGRSVLYAPGVRRPVGANWSRIQEHEHVHIRQTEDGYAYAFVLSLIVALATGNWLVGLLIWSCGDFVRWALHGTAAMLRGGRFYRDAENERSAYAQTDCPKGGKSWLEQQRASALPTKPAPREVAPRPSIKELDPGCGHEGCLGISHCIEDPP